ncbi:hypothetical protein QBC47DRAFT_377960 [Echria macrotheca]|uniref:Uncharacterized protein n=1 Tax=Echria macrotheca TaxID=438768 RepID=A0AAJ0FB14_9PEZI|nr:hypothetical protein QBC47DRAFT_377960 [Echria macrotheca]
MAQKHGLGDLWDALGRVGIRRARARCPNMRSTPPDAYRAPKVSRIQRPSGIMIRSYCLGPKRRVASSAKISPKRQEQFRTKDTQGHKPCPRPVGNRLLYSPIHRRICDETSREHQVSPPPAWPTRRPVRGSVVQKEPDKAPTTPVPPPYGISICPCPTSIQCGGEESKEEIHARNKQVGRLRSQAPGKWACGQGSQAISPSGRIPSSIITDLCRVLIDESGAVWISRPPSRFALRRNSAKQNQGKIMSPRKDCVQGSRRAGRIFHREERMQGLREKRGKGIPANTPRGEAC